MSIYSHHGEKGFLFVVLELIFNRIYRITRYY